MRKNNFSLDANIAGEQAAKEREYWLNTLSGDIEKSRFPYDFDKVGFEEQAGEENREAGRLTYTVGGELCTRLLRMSNNSDVRLYMILVTGLFLLLGKYGGNKDIIVLSPIYKQDIEGDFINTVLALRNRLKDSMTFKDLLLQVKKNHEEAVENQNYPIEPLLNELNIPVDQKDFPLTGVSILLENIHFKHYLDHFKTDISFSFLKTGGSIQGTVEYNEALYKKTTIEQIIDRFQLLLEKTLARVDTPVSRVDLVAEKERKEILNVFNDTGSDYPRDKTIGQLFEEQVKKTPDKIALVQDGTGESSQGERRVSGVLHLSYRQLDEEANRLARLLREKGVKPDDIAAVMIDHTIDMVTAIFGILKAGAAYLPVETNLPDKRIRSMLDDCGVSILLTKDRIVGSHSFTALQSLYLKQVKCRRTAPRPNIKDLDMLPITDRSLIDYEKYSRYISMTYGKNSIAMQATRGCPYNCAYCHKIWPKTHVYRSAEHIFKEVQVNYDLGIRRFSFYDDIFNLNKKNSRRFLELIIKNGLDVQLFFPGGLRGDILTKDYIDLMAEAGTVDVALALETASPRLQKLIKKNLKIATFRENIEYFCEKYPQVILDLYTMHGFPTETEEEAVMTLDFIKSLRWVHFPAVHVLKIYENTDMEKLAMENGITRAAIVNSTHLAFHELPETLPFDMNFTKQYQTAFMNDYFLSKERLLHVLPYQMKVLSEDEMVQKYNSYLPIEINRFDDLLEFVDISRAELPACGFYDDKEKEIPGLHEKMKKAFPIDIPAKHALRILLLDLSLLFTDDTDLLYDPVEPPLGLMALMTYINRQFGSKVNGKIAQSRIDFDSFEELRTLLEEFEPAVIGLRTLGKFKDFFHRTTAEIRGWGIDVPVISGGPYATSEYENILQDRNIDLIVLGEGETTFAELVEKIIENNDKLPEEDVLNRIAGIAYVPESEKRQKPFAREIMMVDKATAAPAQEPPPPPGNIDRSTSLSYVIFTSGSTGKPKGVMVEHRSLANLCYWHNKVFQVTGSDNAALYANYCFDASVWELFPYLIKGSTLHVIDEAIRLDVEKINEYYNKHDISISFLPTQVFEQFIRIENNSLRLLLTGADKLNTFIAKRYRLINNYGPTENTVVTTSFVVDKSYRNIPIGKPVANTRVYILDSNENLLPAGVPGELCIAGDGLSRGYLNNQELTGEKFTANPFAAGENMYKTGDLARWLPAGNIEFLGRIDRQVKIRAHRIELGEIESRLMAFTEIKEAVVIAREDKNGDKYLIAYIVARGRGSGSAGGREAAAIDHALIEKKLSHNLPGYMVPAYFVELGKMPLLPNGKIDRKTLPEPGLLSRADYIAPRNDIEKKLVKIWSGVLNVDEAEIGIHADFFGLGGHSLTAAKLTSKIHKELNVKVSLDEVFKKLTVSELSGYIKNLKQDMHESIPPTEKKEYYELSSAQKRLYIMQQIEYDSIGYKIQGAIYLDKDVESDKLETIFGELIERHESLRTSFAIINEKPVQRIHEKVDFSMEHIELKAGDENRQIEKITGDFNRPFDLSKAPLFRVGLITGKEHNILLVDMHHIISDGISYQVLEKEFRLIYNGDDLPGLKLQYTDYANWQNSTAHREKIEKQKKYWLEKFEGEIPLLNLQYDFDRPAVKTYEGSHLFFDIEKPLAAQLTNLVKETRTTLFIVLLTGYYILLSKYSDNEDIVVGSPITGRSHTDLDHVIGMFINMLSIRNRPQGDKTIAEFLKEVKECVVGTMENQDYQFDQLVAELGLQGAAGRNPLFDVVFVMQNLGGAAGRDTNNETENSAQELEYETAKFDLLVRAAEKNDTIKILVEYSTSLFKQATVEIMYNHYVEILNHFAENINTKLKEIRLTHDFSSITSTELAGFDEDFGF